MYIFKYILCLLCFLKADLLMAGEVLECDRSSKTLDMKCVILFEQGIEDEDAEQVIVRDNNGYWVASGKVHKIEKDRVIAIFDSTDSIKVGYTASVKHIDQEADIDYDMTFEQNFDLGF